MVGPSGGGKDNLMRAAAVMLLMSLRTQVLRAPPTVIGRIANL
ncbi:hypothetical protein OAJ57_02110 [Alphaproteobacteria bacterium]|nr:hypothetical protein [Alphaproteobacteria bacterium]